MKGFPSSLVCLVTLCLWPVLVRSHVCIVRPADVVFVIEDFTTTDDVAPQIDFIKLFMDLTTISPDDVQVGLVKAMAGTANPVRVFHPSQHATSDAMTTALDAVTDATGSGSTIKMFQGISFASLMLNSIQSRDDQPRYMVIFSSIPFTVHSAMFYAFGAERGGVEILLIDQGTSRAARFAAGLASHPLLYFGLNDGVDIDSVLPTLEKMVCETSPEIVQFEVNATTTSLHVKPDEPVQVICQGYGNPALTLSVTGTYSKREVISQLPVSFTFAQGVDVSVTFKAGQSDMYVCTASNSLGTVQQSVEVLVYGPPELYAAPEQERRVSASGVMTFTFKVICQPDCTYSVKRVISSGTVEVASTPEQLEFNPHYRTIRLTVTSLPDPLTPNDLAHEFTVTAVNAEGSLDISFMGFYYGPPELYGTSHLEQPVLVDIFTVTFAVDLVTRLPLTSFSLSRTTSSGPENVDSNSFSKDFQRRDDVPYGTLTITLVSVSLDSVNNFLLTVGNGAGDLDIPFVAVRSDVPPVIEVFTGNSEAGPVTLATGDSFSLLCQATGHAPILHISDDRGSLKAVQGSPTSQTGSRLEWSGRVDSRWSGTLTCHASNGAGSVSRSLSLVVNGPPELYQESDGVERLVMASPDRRVSSCWYVISTPAPEPTSGFVLKYLNNDRSLHRTKSLNQDVDTATFDPVNDLYGKVCLDIALSDSNSWVSYFILTLTTSAGHLDIPFVAVSDLTALITENNNTPRPVIAVTSDASDTSDDSDISDTVKGLGIGLGFTILTFLVAGTAVVCLLQSQISMLKKAHATQRSSKLATHPQGLGPRRDPGAKKTPYFWPFS